MVIYPRSGSNEKNPGAKSTPQKNLNYGRSSSSTDAGTRGTQSSPVGSHSGFIYKRLVVAGLWSRSIILWHEVGFVQNSKFGDHRFRRGVRKICRAGGGENFLKFIGEKEEEKMELCENDWRGYGRIRRWSFYGWHTNCRDVGIVSCRGRGGI